MSIEAMDKLVIDDLLIEEDVPTISSTKPVYVTLSSDRAVHFNTQIQLVEAEIERERRRDGIPLYATVVSELEELAGRFKISL